MFKLPKDVHDELQRRYPTYNIEELIHNIFDVILKKAVEDGACTIREFGKFMAFKTFSGRVQKEVPRFKFRITNALLDKLQKDSYTMQNMIQQKANKFTKEHEKKCEGGKEQRELNIATQNLAMQTEKKRTIDKIARQEIMSILEDQ